MPLASSIISLFIQFMYLGFNTRHPVMQEGEEAINTPGFREETEGDYWVG
jgi:hypothetical protein